MEQRLKRSENEAGVGTVAFEGEYVFVIPAKAGIHFDFALLLFDPEQKQQQNGSRLSPG